MKLTRYGVLDLCYIREMGSVGYAEASHAVGVTPFSEMTLESFRTFVGVIATNFTVVTYVQAVQLVQPVRNGLK